MKKVIFSLFVLIKLAFGISVIDHLNAHLNSMQISKMVMEINESIKQYNQQLRDYENQYQQLQRLIESAELQRQNLKRLGDYKITDFNDVLSTMYRISSGMDDLTFNLTNNVDTYKRYAKPIEKYEAMIAKENTEAGKQRAVKAEFERIQKATGMEYLGAAVSDIDKQIKELKNDKEIEALRKKSDAAKGTVSAVQASNALLVMQIREARKLRLFLLAKEKRLLDFEAKKQEQEKLRKAVHDQLLPKN